MANKRKITCLHPMILKEYKDAKCADLFILRGDEKISEKNQFVLTRSPIYNCDEYVWVGELNKGDEIKFCHADMRYLPNVSIYNNISGPGITLSGTEACVDFSFKDALTCPVTDCDLIYNFVNGSSKLFYVGENKVHTLFLRVYDNNLGSDNDRWLVISVE